MDNSKKTKAQLIAELEELQKKVVEHQKTEKLLNESEERFRLLYDNAPLGCHSLDENGHLVEVNKAWLDKIGYCRDEVIGKWFGDFLAPDYKECFRKNFSRFKEQGEIQGVEYELVKKDGSQIYVLLDGKLSRDPDGGFGQTNCVWKEITELKKTEKALRDSEFMMRSIFRAAPVGIGVVSNRIIKMVNQRMCEMVGYAAEELIGKNARFLYPTDEEYEYVGREKYMQIKEKGTGTVETRLKCKDGRIIDVVLSSTPIDLSNLEAGVTFTALDITERKAAEEALRLSEEKFRELVELLPEMIFECDLDGCVTYLSQQGFALFGVGIEDFEKGVILSDYLIPEDRERAKEDIGRVLRGEDLGSNEYTLMKKDGSPVPVLVHSTAMYKDGKPVGLRGIVVDMTERKAAEEALRLTQFSVDHFSDAAYWMGPDGRFIYVNDTACRTLGYSREELLNMTVHDINPEFPEETWEHYWEKFKRSGSSIIETVHRRKNGEVFPVEISANYIEFSGREYNCAFARDISDRRKAEESLKESEARLKKAQEAAKIGAWDFDVASGMFWGSEEAFRIFGFTRDSEYLPIEEVDSRITNYEEVRKSFADLIRNGKEYDIEYEVTRKIDGKRIFIHSVGERILDKQGVPVKVTGFIQDVTERKLSELRKESLQHVREAVWKMQKPEDLQAVSHRIKKSLVEHKVPFQNFVINAIDRSEDDVTVHSYFLSDSGEWIKADNPEGERTIVKIWRDGVACYRKDLEKEDIFHERGYIEEHFDVKVRSVLDVPFSHGTIAINSPEPGAFSENDIKLIEELAEVLSEGFVRVHDLKNLETYAAKLEKEIIEHKKTENSLMESENFYHSTIDSINDAVHVVDTDLRIILVNTVTMRWVKELSLGENIVGMTLPEAFPFISKEAIDEYYRVIETGETVSGEEKNKFGNRFVITETRKIPVIEHGNVSRIITIVRDVTDQKRLEEQFLQSQKMESVGRLAGGIAHDFNNILTAIIGNAELALMSLSRDDPLYEDINEIKMSGERASDLTRQLLAFSRRQIVVPKLINLNSTLINMHKMLKRIVGEDIEIVTVPAENLWNVKVDPGQIEQVLTNLVVNARDAMPEGGKLTIETANVDLDDEYCQTHADTIPGSYVMMAVSDTGVGMDEETAALVFEPFFTTKETGKGTGLGLSTCYGIVKQNNGNIWVYSEPGQGTTIKVYLPRSIEKETGFSETKEPDDSFRGTETILVAEDEPSVRKMTVRILQERGYAVYEASNGEEALRLVLREEPGEIHLLLTDIIMPRMGGKELYSRIKNMIPGIRVLFMSGYTDNSIVHHGVLEDGVAFLQKPFTPSDVVKKVRHVLDE